MLWPVFIVFSNLRTFENATISVWLLTLSVDSTILSETRLSIHSLSCGPWLCGVREWSTLPFPPELSEGSNETGMWEHMLGLTAQSPYSACGSEFNQLLVLSPNITFKYIIYSCFWPNIYTRSLDRQVVSDTNSFYTYLFWQLLILAK